MKEEESNSSSSLKPSCILLSFEVAKKSKDFWDRKFQLAEFCRFCTRIFKCIIILIKMDKTLKNLAKAFIGESQARNRYTFYSQIAKEEGYEQIGEIFIETANHEKEHAKRLFEHIQELKGKLGNNEKISVETEAPTIYGTTAENLKAAINGEHFENSEMYPEFAKIAEKEGLYNIANRLRSIAKAEKHHEERYEKLLKEIKTGTVFKKKNEVEWVCRECGYVHLGKEAPEKCPSCDHERYYYQIRSEEY